MRRTADVDHVTADLVDIDHMGTAFGEEPGDGGLAGPDAAGQADDPSCCHRASVPAGTTGQPTAGFRAGRVGS